MKTTTTKASSIRRRRAQLAQRGPRRHKHSAGHGQASLLSSRQLGRHRPQRVLHRLIGVLWLSVVVSNVQGQQIPRHVETLYAHAQDGNAESQYFLGRYFLSHFLSNRIDHRQSLRHAVDWLRQAAQQQQVHAMYWLGTTLAMPGDMEDPETALRWMQNAAQAGLASAQARLGSMYYAGYASLRSNCQVAIQWLERAVGNVDGLAQANLAWVLATCPDDRYRDGARALRLINEVIYRQGLNNPAQMDTQAAAYAELGDYVTAWETAEEALAKLAPEEIDQRMLIVRHLEKFRARLPWRGPDT